MSTQQRTSDWFLTFTGKRFFPLEPHVDDVCIEDIAHALSRLCRFGGHSREFYSVAQHSVLVAQSLPDELKLQGLMHDATEAYCGGVIRPIKYNLPKYQEIEDAIWTTIALKFGLPPSLLGSVKAADNRLLMTERRDLLPATEHRWSLEEKFPPFDFQIVPWVPALAEFWFTQAFVRFTSFATA